jgi:hypothetical protein
MANPKDKRKPKEKIPLPKHFSNAEEAGIFWDTHDSSDYEDYAVEVECAADIRRRTCLVPVDSDLYRAVRSIARRKGISAETLVNMWIQEKAS